MPESRVVLITGASSGFGRETARLLLSRGFKVYGTSRNPSAKPQESGVGMLALDVDSDDSVKNGVKELLDETGFFKTNLGNTRKTTKYTIRDYDELRQRATAELDEDFENGADPRLVGEMVLRIITSRSPKLEYAVGREKRYKTLKHLMPQSIIENGVRRHWKLDR